ncbi:MAG: YbaN family protein [Rhodospirillaceae bacterium]
MTEKGESPVGTIENCWMRWILLAFGWANVALGVIGAFLPGLPTTVFLLIALWAFSRSSLRFHGWLWHHPRLGPPVRDWHTHKVIPRKAKWLAILTMTASFVYIADFVASDWKLPALMAAILVPAALFIVTRASAPPDMEPVPVEETAEG